ncbi:MAG: 23S rRNA (adenine(2503)-C(2))-methyltransferase RlmN [Armatimonadetes bacterium]|nr:23S rRNA (adenine(2503)-C(2))-methyltransferase RlmN [Armatimonadota bacterium]
MRKPSIYEISEQALIDWLAERGQPRYRARQIQEWTFKHFVPSFDEMTTLPKPLRKELAQAFEIGPLPVLGRWEGRDSVKLLLRLQDGAGIECVRMKTRWGETACVSSQVGCAVRCVFCASGAEGLERNLAADEIIRQIVSLAADGGRITNVVFMGMGEPLHNYDAVLEALDTITSPDRMGISPRRVTVGTAGVVPAIRRLARDAPKKVELAVSLGAPTDKLRRALMPGVAQWTLKELLMACDEWTETRNGQPVTYAYVLLHGINDSMAQAERLAALLKNRRHHVNLIRLNPVGNSELRPSSKDRTIQFARTLEALGINVSIRRSLGRDIEAACGQLRLQRLRSDRSASP